MYNTSFYLKEDIVTTGITKENPVIVFPGEYHLLLGGTMQTPTPKHSHAVAFLCEHSAALANIDAYTDVASVFVKILEEFKSMHEPRSRGSASNN